MISPDAGNMGTKAVLVWAGLLVPTTILLYFYYPETQGRTYVELDELYERGISARNFKYTATLSDQTGAKGPNTQDITAESQISRSAMV